MMNADQAESIFHRDEGDTGDKPSDNTSKSQGFKTKKGAFDFIPFIPLIPVKSPLALSA
jgi:hypothetical protein